MLKEEDIIIDRDSLPEELRELSLEELLPGKDDIVVCELFTGYSELILAAREKLLELREICSSNEEATSNLDIAIQLLFEALEEPNKLLEAIDALDKLLLSMDSQYGLLCYLHESIGLQDELLCCMHQVYNLLCPLLCLVLATDEQQTREDFAVGVDSGPLGGDF